MNFLKKLAGLGVFVLALALAIGVTQYYASHHDAKHDPDARHGTNDAPPPPPKPSAPASRSEPPVFFKARLFTLDFTNKRAHMSIDFEKDPSRPAPERFWVGAYFFVPGGAGAPTRSWTVKPTEVNHPFAGRDRFTDNITVECDWCGAPDTPLNSYYARVVVSDESADAVRLSPEQMNFSLEGAMPVVVEAGNRKAR